MWTSKEVSHPKQELLLISFCLFLCCCLLFCCCFFILLLFFCFFLWWHYTCILSVKDNILNESFEMELLRGNCIVVNQLASTIVSQLFQCIRVLFFSFFGLCFFFLMSYTPNFKIFTRITFIYEFLPISFLSCLNAYFYAFFFSFFQRFLPSSHGVTGVPPLVWHFTLMACKIFDSAVVVNTNTNLVMSWVVEMVIFSLLLLRELHPVTGKLSIMNVYMHSLLSGSDSVLYYW